MMYGDINTTTTSTDISALGGVLSVIFIIITIVGIIGIVINWKIFTKAGREGWKSLIPFYNLYVEFEIAGMNGWMFLLMLVPFVGYVMPFILMYKLGKAFGKSAAFCVGLILLSPIFLAILAFGSSEYALSGASNTNFDGDAYANAETTSVNNADSTITSMNAEPAIENVTETGQNVSEPSAVNNVSAEPAVQEVPEVASQNVNEPSAVNNTNIPSADEVFGTNTPSSTDNTNQNNAGQNNMMN